MPGLLPEIDPDGLLEFSVVFTDRSVNHMSQKFQGVMVEISSTLKRVYNAAAVARPVTCAPQRSLSLPIIDRSASSEEERARRRRFASCFL